MTVAARVEEIMGADDFGAIQGRFPDALVLALDAYSTVSPLVLSNVCQVNSTTAAVVLPDSWAQGFSSPKIVLREDVVALESDGTAISFAVTDWVLNAGSYEFVVIHNLESTNLLVEFMDDNNNFVAITWQVVTANSIKIFTSVPFAGKVMIEVT